MDYPLVSRSILLISLMLSSACFAQNAQLENSVFEKSVFEISEFKPHLRTIDAADLQGLSVSSTLAASDEAEHRFTATLASFKEVGRGEMQWWWFTLYRARLLTPDGGYSQGTYPLVLEIEYYQEIPSARLLEATVDQWQHLGLDSSRQQQWQTTLSELWPDVTEGDKLSLKVTSSQVSQFYFNGKPLSKAMPAGFSDDFLAIWLSEQTSRPSLRKLLLGEVACDC